MSLCDTNLPESPTYLTQTMPYISDSVATNPANLTVYRVTGRRYNGLQCVHHVGAVDVHQAVLSVLNADTKIARIDRVVISEYN